MWPRRPDPSRRRQVRPATGIVGGERLRVLFASTSGSGHFRPLVPFVEAFRRRHAAVMVAGPPSLAGAAADAGCEFWPGADPPAAEAEAVWQRFASLPREQTSGLVDRELFGRLCTAAMLPAMEAACWRWRPHLVLREPCEYSSAVTADRAGIPHAVVAISLATIEASVHDLVADVLGGDRADVESMLGSAPYLTSFPASLDPSPFARTWRWRPARRQAAAPLPDWWAGRGGPLVYVTFGTVAGRLPVGVPVYRAAIDALAGLEARVLLTVGHSTDVSVLGPLPPNVHVEPWVPQDDVLGAASAVVCHGGSGTTFGALDWARPLVIVPLFADQPSNAGLVAAAGAGEVVEPPRSADGAMATLGPADVERLASAIKRVLSDPSYTMAARRIAHEMAGLPTVDDVAARLVDELVGS